ncbi:hypothetical protein SAMN05421644_1291 [Allochromatium warmingii]|uniref:Uncharacterized protein n=1 Tax=Allochromatium warmingii TaxID=61595 RepID=A0A1H3H1L7_ALLWA|nr:hypothetical protein [Allochromatium warmingii]SDY09277.1 hypothetical protein SAMN05421644_1291 [Allochromatium warmingii]
MKTVTKVTLLSALMISSASVYAGSCNVHVSRPDGGSASGVRVVGSVYNGAQTRSIDTNSSGVAILTWTNDNKLDDVFVNDSSTGQQCYDGGNVSYQMR